ncbi:MAG TPA: hypothetical protein VFR15_16225 [Chloroflexia bacterium]|nr:hypothetical protein [Chloroflexia bacterium]
MTPPVITLGVQLRELESRYGLSGRLIEHALGVSRGVLDEWYSDRTKPPRDELLKIAVLLGDGKETAAALLKEAGYGPLTDADEVRLGAIESDPSYATIINAQRTYRALGSLAFATHRATDQGSLTRQLETQLKGIQTLLQAQKGQQPTAEASAQVDRALAELVAQAQETAQLLTAEVVLPSREEMQVRLVSANSLERLEEYRNEESKWFSIAGVLIGAGLGIFVNVATGGTMTSSAWLVMGLLALLGGFTGFTARQYGQRAHTLRERIMGAPTVPATAKPDLQRYGRT